MYMLVWESPHAGAAVPLAAVSQGGFRFWGFRMAVGPRVHPADFSSTTTTFARLYTRGAGPHRSPIFCAYRVGLCRTIRVSIRWVWWARALAGGTCLVCIAPLCHVVAARHPPLEYVGGSLFGSHACERGAGGGLQRGGPHAAAVCHSACRGPVGWLGHRVRDVAQVSLWLLLFDVPLRRQYA